MNVRVNEIYVVEHPMDLPIRGRNSYIPLRVDDLIQITRVSLDGYAHQHAAKVIGGILDEIVIDRKQLKACRKQ